jgi:hypothetical protein
VNHRYTKRIQAIWRITGLLVLLLSSDVLAQSQQKGDASLRIEYQYIGTGAYEGDSFSVDYWTTDSHVALISGDYALSDKWTVYAALPYVQKRFVAEGVAAPWLPPGDPHDPTADYWVAFVPPDQRFHDDGDYHGGLQDLSFGVMYRAIDGPSWTVSPYIGYAVPASNYPFYAKAAIGLNLWQIPVGVDVGWIPYFSDWHFRGNLAYVFSEEPLGQNVDYLLGFLSAGYWFKPNFSMDLFFSTKYLVDGLLIDYDFSDNPFIYPIGYDTELWYHHDRLLKHRILNLGIGFDYFLNEKYQLSGTYFETIWADQTNEVDRAFSIAVTRYFGGD